jgi:hypothetical protein
MERVGEPLGAPDICGNGHPLTPAQRQSDFDIDDNIADSGRCIA